MMRASPVFRVSAIVVCGLLAGCTLFRPVGSWVEITEARDAGPLADAIVSFVAESAPEPGASIELISPPEEQSGNLLTLQLREKLTSRGYWLQDRAAAGSHSLRYLVSPYQRGILLRVTLDGAEASIIFARDSAGMLGASAPLALRQKGKGV